MIGKVLRLQSPTKWTDPQAPTLKRAHIHLRLQHMALPITKQPVVAAAMCL